MKLSVEKLKLFPLGLQLTIVVIILENSAKINGHQCSVSSTIANCEEKSYSSVPTDLSPTTEVLDLSYNPLASISSESFKPYPKLRILRLTNLLAGKTSIAKDSFEGLSKLTEVDLTKTNLGNSPDINFPRLMEVIKVDNTNFGHIDLSPLKRMKQFYGSGNRFTELQPMHKFAPYTTINLKNNPINYVKAEKLAPYCELQFLGLDITPNSSLLAQENACDCHRLKRWIQERGIDGVNEFECHLSGAKNCDPNFSEEMIKDYNSCLKRVQLDWWDILKLGGIFLLALLLVSAIFFSILYAYQMINDTEGLPERKKKTSIAQIDPSTGAPNEFSDTEELQTSSKTSTNSIINDLKLNLNNLLNSSDLLLFLQE